MLRRDSGPRQTRLWDQKPTSLGLPPGFNDVQRIFLPFLFAHLAHCGFARQIMVCGCTHLYIVIYVNTFIANILEAVLDVTDRTDRTDTYFRITATRGNSELFIRD